MKRSLFVVLAWGLGCGGAEPRRAVQPTVAVAEASPPPPFFDGIGTHTRKVTTTSPEAQRYFDQGLAFMTAFNHDEAERSFARAAALDPSCAMAHWGVAMVNGPHINNATVDEAHAKRAWAALGRAREAAAKSGSKVERDLVDALGKRYADPPPSDRGRLDLAYANAMRAVHRGHPEDVDVAAWFAEAMMDLRPWDAWTPDGKPQPGTEEIVSVLEQTMERAPKHPLALHLYIHAVEASPRPEKADAAADGLRDLAPGLGHLVHMPSHIDIRRGRWGAAITANERAIAADAKYRERSSKQGFYNFYMGHNWHMLSFAAMMQGQSDKALAAADAMLRGLDRSWAHEHPLIADGLLALPVEVLMRFGRWDEILAFPEPEATFPFARTLRHYARAVTYAVQDELANARAEQAAFLEAKKLVPPATTFGNNPASSLVAIAEGVLDGEIAVREGRTDAAIASLRAAVRREDALRYDEPPDWIQPVRHALGATLVRAGRPAEAEAVYREDLAKNLDNGWSLFGLSRALRMQKKDAEAKPVTERFARAWQNADVKLSSSCFCLPGI